MQRFAIARSPSSSPYEISCPRCRVTFPPEARTCVHCGGPLGGRFAIGMRADAPAEVASDPGPESEGAGGGAFVRGLLRAPLVILLIVFWLARTCMGN